MHGATIKIITLRFYYGKESRTSLKLDADYAPWAVWAFGETEKY